MRYRFRAHLPFVIGSLIALCSAGMLLQMRYQLEVARQKTQMQAELDSTASEMAALLYRNVRSMTWHPWQLATYGYAESTATMPVPAANLWQSLHKLDQSEFPRLIGPFATEQGRNVVAIVASHVASAANGSWTYSDQLLSPQRLTSWVKDGYRIQLFDQTEQFAIFQSEEGPLTTPLSANVPFGGSHLALRAAPRDGWRVPISYFSSCLLIAVALILFLTYELRRSQALINAHEDVEDAEMRRHESNIMYGSVLQSLAALESRLHAVSMYDSVTGLANRSSLVHRIDSLLASMRQASPGTLGVLAIGFDHVHHITNSFGAEFASRVLVVAAERVEFVLQAKDQMFRIGDFHLAVVPPLSEAGAFAELAQRIIEEVEAPISLDSHTFMLHPSIGIVESRSGYEYSEALVDRADAALGAVHRDAPIRYCLFDSATAKESVTRLQLEVDLDRAFDENQFVLEYEPFVLPVTHEVVGFEALIRWNHPTEGRISPGRFVPIAVQAGMSHRLNDWVMREAARQASEWRHAGYSDVFVNFNLSAEAFLRTNLAEEIAAVLADYDLPGRNLIVELTESTLIQDIRGAARTLQRLAELGVGAWLDDFGTGYSSLSYLRALPLKGVKIDRSFIERSVIDARDFGFLKALIDLISYLGMKSIAEGIENREQYELLSLTSCELYQGYHFSRSMPAAQAERWMREPGRIVKRSRSA